MNIRKEVLDFALDMERKLRDNDHKDHWSSERFSYLLRRLEEEVKELKMLSFVSTDTSLKRKAIINESADVANIAMMIADNAKNFRD